MPISVWPLLIASLVLAALVGALALEQRARQRLGGQLGALVKFVLAAGMLAAVTYLTLYFLALVGGFYESLTCKVVSIPACEDPLPLPAWLRLPAQSVGGVMGVLPLLAVFLAKTLQPRTAPQSAGDTAVSGETGWAERLARDALGWLRSNSVLIVILLIELWLAALRGQAEAADRQVRLALGLDGDLPSAYLSVARWGALVLALGLSAVAVALGTIGRALRLLVTDAFADLGHGAALAEVLGALLRAVAAGVAALFGVVAIAVGRGALKSQAGALRLWALIASSLGRLLLKSQSLLLRAWVFLGLIVGLPLLWIARAPGRLANRLRARNTLPSLLLLFALGVWGSGEATTYVVLFDATGSEAGRIEHSAEQVLAWADPSPERSLLARGDRLIVVPIRSPGKLDANYSALFNGTYPSNQLERYSFFTGLRDALPRRVDEETGTGLSEALRAAVFYLEQAQDERVLVVFGNGEDHSPDPVEAAELAAGLSGATVIHLNLGREHWQHWDELYLDSGVSRRLLYDLAASRSLRVAELTALLAGESR